MTRGTTAVSELFLDRGTVGRVYSVFFLFLSRPQYQVAIIGRGYRRCGRDIFCYSSSPLAIFFSLYVYVPVNSKSIVYRTYVSRVWSSLWGLKC